MTFQFDTSGVVELHDPAHLPRETRFSDLSPFVQGYVEAMAQTLGEHCAAQDDNCYLRFSDLAPETLARIMEDCERGVKMSNGLHPIYRKNKAGGAAFWTDRQRGRWALTNLRPLTPYLGDDGKVRLREVGQ
jgi:hypothetical protein